MCGRYSLFTPPADLEDRFDARFVDDVEPRYNAAPGQRLPVVTNDAPDEIRRLEWGLVTSWADDDADGLINARAETIDEKPSFREAYERRRCLVLADGFYEWVEPGRVDGPGDEGGADGADAAGDGAGADGGNGTGSEGGANRNAGRKRPYRIAFEDDRPFAMAGLWERWEPETEQTGLGAFGGGASDEGGETDDGILETFTIVTTEPNDLVADLHHRMAAILEPEEERRWLEADDPRAVLDPHPADELRAYPVSRAVNSPANDEPSLVEPV